jgi:hypothetical protein
LFSRKLVPISQYLEEGEKEKWKIKKTQLLSGRERKQKSIILTMVSEDSADKVGDIMLISCSPTAIVEPSIGKTTAYIGKMIVTEKKQ